MNGKESSLLRKVFRNNLVSKTVCAITTIFLLSIAFPHEASTTSDQLQDSILSRHDSLITRMLISDSLSSERIENFENDLHVAERWMPVAQESLAIGQKIF